uniref:Kinesin motor domain-containing protein n=1 Tax=Trichuris muris TaxID=70415 RepID=A0A5S6QUX3_TRIMR
MLTAAVATEPLRRCIRLFDRCTGIRFLVDTVAMFGCSRSQRTCALLTIRSGPSRKSLHSQLRDAMAKSIPVKVAIRCRPMALMEKEQGATDCLQILSDHRQVVIDGRCFQFDEVFGHSCSQHQVYESCAAPLCDSFFEGYNCTIFAYGQTGSGKTYTMGTEEKAQGSCPESGGLIIRIISNIFNHSEAQSNEFEFNFSCSMLEIYNETVFDLLGNREPLMIREHQTEGVYVQNLTLKRVENLTDTLQCLEEGCINRSQGQTAMNATSSRSHAIFTIYMTKISRNENANCYKAKLNLVDLAGSERLKKTQAEGKRMKEGIKINEGLLALGNVISALTETTNSRVHVPYRDSKLTRLLQDSLGGNSVTVMIACVSPADTNHEETLNTLRYAERAKKIKNKPLVNLDPTAAELLRLRQENEIYRRALGLSPGSSFANAKQLTSSTELEETRRRVLALETQCEKMERYKDRYLRQAQNLLSAEFHRDVLHDCAKEVQEKLYKVSEMSAPPDVLDALTIIIQDIANVIKSVENQNASMFNASSGDDEESLEQKANLEQADEKEAQSRFEQLSREIKEKEKQISEAENDLSESTGHCHDHKGVIEDLCAKVSALTAEKDELANQLKTLTKCTKMNEQRRQRINELEKQITDLNKKLVATRNLERFKVQSENYIKELRSQIYVLKQTQVNCLRQKREEAARARKAKATIDREMNILRDRKRRVEYEALKDKRRYDRILSVYQRKYEAATALSRRLQDQISRMTRERPGTKKMIGNSKTIADYVRRELYLAIGSAEAKFYCKQLLSQRETLYKQLMKLKKDAMDRGDAELLPSERSDLDQQESELIRQIELRSARVTELRRRITEYELCEKSKYRFANVSSVDDAKMVLQVLFDQAVMANLNQKRAESTLQEVNDYALNMPVSSNSQVQQSTVMGSPVTPCRVRMLTELCNTQKKTIEDLSERLKSAETEQRRLAQERCDDKPDSWKRKLYFGPRRAQGLSDINEQTSSNENVSPPVPLRPYLPTPRKLIHLVRPETAGQIDQDDGDEEDGSSGSKRRRADS